MKFEHRKLRISLEGLVAAGLLASLLFAATDDHNAVTVAPPHRTAALICQGHLACPSQQR